LLVGQGNVGEWLAGEHDGLVRLFLQLATGNWQLTTCIGLAGEHDGIGPPVPSTGNWQLGNWQPRKLQADWVPTWADWETYHTDRILPPKCCQCCQHTVNSLVPLNLRLQRAFGSMGPQTQQECLHMYQLYRSSRKRRVASVFLPVVTRSRSVPSPAERIRYPSTTAGTDPYSSE